MSDRLRAAPTALDASMRDVEASRRRLAATAAGERRRIERDLHDGAQQQLVTLRIGLELTEEEMERDPKQGVERLRALTSRVDSIIGEVRAIARGLYPSLLADAGLTEALRAVARLGESPIKLNAQGLDRYPLEIEAAVYFCCVEALQNATKHANASAISVDIQANESELRFHVRDNGEGFAADGRNGGSGLTNMRDRVAALGGSLAIDSAPGSGTAVRGRVPVNGADRGASESSG